MSRFAFAMAFLLLASLAAAGTLTLSGLCRNPVDGTSIVFNLSNSNLSNDTAYNIGIQPFISGARSASEGYAVNGLLQPGAGANVSISLSNITARGTYADYFVTTYMQGMDSFTAVFPCLVSFHNTTVSQIYLTPSVSPGPNGTAKVSVSLFSAANVTANVSLILPPTFLYESARQLRIGLGPYITKNATFYLKLPSSAQVSYGVAAAAQYEEGNLSYARYVSFSISQQKLNPPLDLGSVLLWASAAVVALLVALLAYVFLKKRKKHPA